MDTQKKSDDNALQEIEKSKLNSETFEECIIETQQDNNNTKSIFAISPGTSPPHTLSASEVDRWRKIAIIVCWIGIVSSIVLGILLFVFSVKDSSAAAFGFGVTALLNALTSMVVMWRYYGTFSAYSEKKEDKALVILGSLFIISAICTAGKTLYNFLVDLRPDISEEAAEKLIIVSIVATVCLGIIGIAQIFIAMKLVSYTLLTDALNSFAGAIVALSLVISSRVTEEHPGYWYIDDITGIIIGCLLFIYGVILLTKYIPILLRTTDYEETS